ncbi:type II toxin-antitoxin system RelE/ParE family toxin [Sphingomonas crocodyli]|uniref:Type II toxin-antitoxin system RelE/ParE family toxin n=1 Tax=Sphingomonas crocodyli TaxID=1979270 RepID=A0A437M5C5_9SPHN|nr:type II toxin-antitoxin system RelE/ParE family toxin [Sphingomonas crocodyli]RVT92852.1 type II toxin-antitoxin system RelE/ParE family toxin [Sphingomonas crocodyli]
MRLELSRKAQADLDDIRDFSVEHHGVDGAIAYLDGIEAAFRRILSFPGVGLVHSALEPVVRSLTCQRHRIFYTADADRALIIRILHQSMNADRLV